MMSVTNNCNCIVNFNVVDRYGNIVRTGLPVTTAAELRDELNSLCRYIAKGKTLASFIPPAPYCIIGIYEEGADE